MQQAKTTIASLLLEIRNSDNNPAVIEAMLLDAYHQGQDDGINSVLEYQAKKRLLVSLNK